MMRYAARTLNKAFGMSAEPSTFLVDTLGRESSLLDIFYCHGMVGVFVMTYLNQIINRQVFYFETTMYYVSMLSDEDKARVAQMITD